MTSRERHTLDWVWNALIRAQTNNDGYPVSAGRVAFEMSCSRNHAAKMLERLVGTGAAQRRIIIHGRVVTQVYLIPRMGDE